MQRSMILAVGGHVPERVVTNSDLCQWMDTSDSWIVERTGINERRWVTGSTAGSELAEIAAKKAVESAGIKMSDIECIIVATISPEHEFPGTGCFLQERLGLAGIPALDVRNQCSGFIYGMSVADAWIRSGQYSCILLTGVEVQSSGLDISTQGRDISVLFGDGAGAVLITAGDQKSESGILSTHLHSDGRYAKALWLEAPGSVFHPRRITQQMLEEGRHFPKMNGRLVFKNAVRYMPKVIRECLDHNGISLDEVSLIVPHQANKRINEMVANELNFPQERMFSNIEKYGNTTAASIPLALWDAQREGKLKKGDLVVLVSFGAGFTWASALVRW